MTSLASNSPHGAVPAPIPTTRVGRRRARLLSLVFGLVLILVAAVYLVAPGWWQWTSANPVHTINQILTPAPPENARLLAQLRTVPSGTQGAPVILTYHNIGTETGFYTVTPTAFAAQMQLLHDAGYHTLTANQLDAWLHGAPLPAHSVLLTFDDGPSGIWQYADPILARYGFHAMAFIITGFVGTRPPYYMNWPEITTLAHSGRWDIESHTNLGHIRFTINAHGDQGPFLTNLHYLASQHRTETVAEYTTRITNDLAASKTQLVNHGVPTPAFFAYPFSANTGDTQLTTILAHAVHTNFDAAMLDDSDGSTATTSTDLASGNLHRTDVVATTSLPAWVTHIRTASALDPTTAQPFADPTNWTTASGSPTHLIITNGTATLDPGPLTWAGRLFARTETSLWRHYTVTATLGGFQTPGDGTVTGLRVLTGDTQQVQLTLSDGTYQVRQSDGNTQRLLTEGNLPPATSYPVTLAVTPTAVTVTVTTRVVVTVSLHPNNGQPPSGGIELTAQREKATSPPSQINHLTINAN
jgi:poly-beta-1,6-N-acetyl-D-glucosamine N-deacetylase